MRKDDKLSEITNATPPSSPPSSINNDLDGTTKAIGHFPSCRILEFSRTIIENLVERRRSNEEVPPIDFPPFIL